MSLLLDVYPDGAYETVEWDYANGQAVIRRFSGDLQAAIDRNKELRNHGQHLTKTHAPGDLDMRWVANVKLDIIYKWMELYNPDGNPRKNGDPPLLGWEKSHWPGIKRLLNSNEWKYLRTSELYL